MSEVFGMPLIGDQPEDGEMVTDAVVIGKVVRLGDSDDPRPSISIWNTAGLDWITQAGMVGIAFEIINHYEGTVDD